MSTESTLDLNLKEFSSRNFDVKKSNTREFNVKKCNPNQLSHPAYFRTNHPTKPYL